MWKEVKWVFCIVLLCLGLTASVSAAGLSSAKTGGDFENTRSVLILPMIAEGNDSYGAEYVQHELGQIFRYPYYQIIQKHPSIAPVPTNLPQITEETDADIVILPRVSFWQTFVSFPFFWDDDYDPMVDTRVLVEIYSYRKGDASVRDDKVTYFNEDDVSSVRNVYIMDDVMRRFYKKFPYRRVPTDISNNLSGAVEVKNVPGKTIPVKDQETSTTPTAPMNK